MVARLYATFTSFKSTIADDLLLLRCCNDLSSLFVAVTAKKKQISCNHGRREEGVFFHEQTKRTRTPKLGAVLGLTNVAPETLGRFREACTQALGIFLVFLTDGRSVRCTRSRAPLGIFFVFLTDKEIRGRFAKGLRSYKQMNAWLVRWRSKKFKMTRSNGA